MLCLSLDFNFSLKVFNGIEAMWSAMEILIGVVCSGLTVLFCWLAYAGFREAGGVVIEGCRPWGNKSEIIAYKCAAGNKTSFGKLFNEIRNIASDDKMYVFFYKGAYLSEGPETHSLYAIGFPVTFKDCRKWTSRGFGLFVLKQVQLAVLASYPLHYRFSESLAVRRTYPELYKYIKERRLCAHPAIEVYDYKKKEVTFVQPLIRQCCFYVPEAIFLE